MDVSSGPESTVSLHLRGRWRSFEDSNVHFGLRREIVWEEWKKPSAVCSSENSDVSGSIIQLKSTIFHAALSFFPREIKTSHVHQGLMTCVEGTRSCRKCDLSCSPVQVRWETTQLWDSKNKKKSLVCCIWHEKEDTRPHFTRAVWNKIVN